MLPTNSINVVVPPAFQLNVTLADENVDPGGGPIICAAPSAEVTNNGEIVITAAASRAKETRDVMSGRFV